MFEIIYILLDKKLDIFHVMNTNFLQYFLFYLKFLLLIKQNITLVKDSIKIKVEFKNIKIIQNLKTKKIQKLQINLKCL